MKIVFNAETIQLISDYNREVGKNICYHRKIQGLSQDFLANAVGVSFSQIQRIEKAQNRICPGRLMYLSHVMKVPIAALLPVENEDRIRKFTREEMALLSDLRLIASDKTKQSILDLVEIISVSRTIKTR